MSAREPYRYPSQGSRYDQASRSGPACLPFRDLRRVQAQLSHPGRSNRQALAESAALLGQALTALDTVPSACDALQEVCAGFHLLLHTLARMDADPIPCSSLYCLLEPMQYKLDAAVDRLTDIL
ncbi:DUF1484 family protein [Chitinimonas sp. JJ19]|uniref:DUF1484 family protein n=1 Tax=Chitinimonas sp. JJ19 TaxID=3109352 RepID=UPI0030025ACA